MAHSKQDIAEKLAAFNPLDEGFFEACYADAKDQIMEMVVGWEGFEEQFSKEKLEAMLEENPAIAFGLILALEIDPANKEALDGTF
jgi:hypothetical protein